MTAPSLPEGVVTFLFTDIEGSTQLLNRLGDRYAHVLMRHRELVDQAITAHEGVVVRTEGDAFFAAFQKASTAVAAAMAAQRALAEEPWPPNSPLRVRMGLHSGEADLVRGDYVGLSVHVAARAVGGRERRADPDHRGDRRARGNPGHQRSRAACAQGRRRLPSSATAGAWPSRYIPCAAQLVGTEQHPLTGGLLRGPAGRDGRSGQGD